MIGLSDVVKEKVNQSKYDRIVGCGERENQLIVGCGERES